jgi:S1-C subfamily serine protease
MWIDLLIILMVGGGIYRGWLSGFTQQFWSSIGFFGGLLFGRLISPYTLNLAHSAEGRTIVTLITFLGSSLFFLTLGEYVGLRLKHRLTDHNIKKADHTLGSIVSVVGAVFGIWLLASLINTLPYPGIRSSVRTSHIVSSLNHFLPPAPNVIASLGRLIDPNGFPDVFIGSEPIPRSDVNLPGLSSFQAAVNADKDSVVRIKGQGCGGIVSGSGFVVGTGLVATNAHVVAGIGTPYVQDVGGTHKGSVIWFDPDLDFAVIRTTNLAGKALNISSAVIKPETPAVVLGYPGGGDFEVDPAAVLEQINASGRNIYGTGHTLRQIYEVKAKVVPGNSGGPLIAQDGSVIGVIFAESTTYNHVGYALTTSKVIPEINQAKNLNRTVNTGKCAE